MAADQLRLFLAAAAILALTPGPGMFYVGARTLAGGLGEGLASTLGTGLGGMVHVLAAAFGLSALILASAEIFTVMKLLGGCYLVWLGWRSWREAGQALATQAPLPALGLLPLLLLGSICVALNTLVDAGVALAAGRVRGQLGQRPGLLRWLRQGSAGLIMALGLGVLLLRRPAG